MEKTLLWIYGRNIGDKPNYASAGTSGGQERLFHLSTVPRGKKSEATDHLTPPTEAAPVRAAQGEEIQINYSSDAPLAATGQTLVSSHRRAGQGNKKVLSDV